MQNIIKKRSNAQDIVKGFLMISVVFFHSHFFTAENPNALIDSFNLLYCFFPYLMVVFFFYCGYNYRPGKRTPKENIIRRSKQLLIPLLILYTVGNLLQAIIVLASGVSTMEGVTNALLYNLMSEPLAHIIGFPANGVINIHMLMTGGIGWYLYALWITSVIFYLIVDKVIKKPVTLISVILLLLVIAFCMAQFIGPYLPYAVNSYPLILAIMLLASYLKQHNFLELKDNSKRTIAFRIINSVIGEAIIVAVSLICYYQFNATLVGVLAGGQYSDVIKGFDVFIAFIFCILGTYAIHSLALIINKIPVVSYVLGWFGKRTGALYISHTLLLSFIHIIIFGSNTFWGEGQNFLYLFITLAIFAIIAMTVDAIKNRIKKPKAAEVKNEANQISN